MYLSIKANNLLFAIVSATEVGLRTYVSKVLIKSFKTSSDFRSCLDNLSKRNIGCSVIFSHRFEAKIKDVLRNYESYYKLLTDCYQSYNSKTYNNNVPYISSIIDLIWIFFDPYFKSSDISKGYTPNQLYEKLQTFVDVRNKLAHPASSRITNEDAKIVLTYIEGVLKNLSDDIFWYYKKEDIKKNIVNFLNITTNDVLPINNFNEISISHRQLVCRDAEISQLYEMLFGRKGYEYYRKSRSIVVYGYGGLGKTALVIELINIIIKNIIDNNNDIGLEYILFLSAKQEQLGIVQTTRAYKINNISKQFSSYMELIDVLKSYLHIQDIKEISQYKKGIIVLDNIETLTDDDKAKLIAFIKTLPDCCQVILTSREEEDVDSKLHLQGFERIENGQSFIKHYIESYQLNIEYTPQLDDLITASKGNTLILVLSLMRLHEGDSLKNILNELNSTSSATMSIVADFMYKNTFDREIKSLISQGYDAKRILSTIAYYDEPIDLYSLVQLANIKDIATAESICNELTYRLILSKSNESYEINEFASKFILVKIIPNRIEATYIKNLVGEFKYKRRQILNRLDARLKSSNSLKDIMNDWSPRNNIDKIAIAEAFDLYSQWRQGNIMANEIKNKFESIQAYSQHPYIKFQKARIFKDIMSNKGVTQERLDIIQKSYEEAIWSINYDYTYILKTKSYAATLWFYGLFLISQFEDDSTGVYYLEQAYDWHIKYGTDINNMRKVAKDLKDSYRRLYKKTKQIGYKEAMNSIILSD